MTLDQPGPAAVRTLAPTRPRRRPRSSATAAGCAAAGWIYFAVIAVVVARARRHRRPSSGRTARPRTPRCTPPRGRPRPSRCGPPSAVKLRPGTAATSTAIGTPYWGGTVVTYSPDSVRGRNGADRRDHLVLHPHRPHRVPGDPGPGRHPRRLRTARQLRRGHRPRLGDRRAQVDPHARQGPPADHRPSGLSLDPVRGHVHHRRRHLRDRPGQRAGPVGVPADGLH